MSNLHYTKYGNLYPIEIGEIILQYRNEVDYRIFLVIHKIDEIIHVRILHDNMIKRSPETIFQIPLDIYEHNDTWKMKKITKEEMLAWIL